MEKKYGLSPKEYEIMEYLWSTNEKVNFKNLLIYFNTVKEENWKKQTLSTFLKKLIDKGLIVVDQSETKYLYFPAYSKEEHIHKWTKKMLKESFDSSLSNFLLAFSGGKNLDKKDVKELKDYLSDFEKSVD